MGKISPLGSFDSAPSSAVSHDKSMRRSAQDDDLVVSWRCKKNQRLLGFLWSAKQVSAYGTLVLGWIGTDGWKWVATQSLTTFSSVTKQAMPGSVLESHDGFNQYRTVPNLQLTSSQRLHCAGEIADLGILLWHSITHRLVGVPKDKCLVPTGPAQSAAPGAAAIRRAS